MLVQMNESQIKTIEDIEQFLLGIPRTSENQGVSQLVEFWGHNT